MTTRPIIAGVFVRKRRHTSLQKAIERRPARVSVGGVASGMNSCGSLKAITCQLLGVTDAWVDQPIRDIDQEINRDQDEAKEDRQSQDERVVEILDCKHEMPAE